MLTQQFFVMRRLVAFLLIIMAFPALAVSPAPNIDSDSYILMDADTGAILAAKNPNLRLSPASLTKIMSILLVFNALRDEQFSMEQPVLISKNAWAANVVGSKTFIEVDTEVIVQDLLYGVIVQSGNDATIALAEALSGDESTFVRWMNQTAKELNLKNSRFANSTGLPADKHYSSAKDIALTIIETIAKHPEMYKIYAKREFEYNGINQSNRNGLLGKFTGADGVKTGYTKEAGYCLASSAKRDGQRLVAVVMKTKSARKRETESAKLLNYGFSHFQNKLLFNNKKTKSLPIFKGIMPTITAKPAESGLITVPRGAGVKAVFHPQATLFAPLKKGDEVGFIEIRNGEKLLRRVSVIAVDDVPEASFWQSLVDDIKIEFLGHGEQRKLSSQW